MLSLRAPEDTHVQHLQQMHRHAFFRLRICIFSSYMDKAALAIVHGQFSSGGLDVAAAKLLDQVLAGAQGEGHDADGGGLVGAVEKDTRIAGVQVRDVVSLPESVGYELFGIVTHPACAGIVEAPTWNIRRIA